MQTNTHTFKDTDPCVRLHRLKECKCKVFILIEGKAGCQEQSSGKFYLGLWVCAICLPKVAFWERRAELTCMISFQNNIFKLLVFNVINKTEYIDVTVNLHPLPALESKWMQTDRSGAGVGTALSHKSCFKSLQFLRGSRNVSLNVALMFPWNEQLCPRAVFCLVNLWSQQCVRYSSPVKCQGWLVDYITVCETRGMRVMFARAWGKTCVWEGMLFGMCVCLHGASHASRMISQINPKR